MHSRPHLSKQNLPSRPFWIFLGASVLFTVGFSTYFFLLNIYLAQMHVSEARIGRIVACMSLGSLAGTIPIGMTASRVGIRGILTFCLPLMSALAALRVFFVIGMQQEMLAFALGFVLCAWAVCLPPSIAQLTTDEQRSFAFSLIFATGIGEAGIGGWLAGILPGWIQHLHPQSLDPLHAMQWTLLLCAGIVAIASVPIALLPLGTTSRSFLPKGKPHPFLYRFLPAVFLWSLMTNALPPFIGIYLTRVLSFSLASVGILFALSQAVQCVAILLSPLLLRKMSQRALMLMAQSVGALAMMALSLWHHAMAVGAIYCIYIAAQYMVEPLLFTALTRSLPPEEHQNGSSFNFFASSLGQSFAGIIAGSLIGHFGYSLAFGVIACAALSLALLIALLLGGSYRSYAHRAYS